MNPLVFPGIKVLIVDDEPGVLEVVSRCLSSDQYAIARATSGYKALQLVKEDKPHILITDLRMPVMDGLELAQSVQSLYPDVDIILMTAYADKETAIQALRLGIYDYLEKPLNLVELRSSVRRVAEKHTLKQREIRLRREWLNQYLNNHVVAVHPRMKMIFETVSQIADSDCQVLITGESGVGKEIVARAIHESSQRRDKAFVVVDCGSLSESLLESELYGHVKGAFTGALYSKKGLLEKAHGGTMLLDEIGVTSLEFQSHLLRVIEQGEIRKVGSIESTSVDIRFLAATNMPIQEKISAGTFREDLYYRLNVVEIKVPPLRERRDDIPPLVHHFIAQMSQSNPSRMVSVSDEALDALVAYDWPGNVRQLRNALARAVAIGDKRVIRRADLPAEVRGYPSPGHQLMIRRDDASQKTEKQLIEEALAATGGHREKTAQMLGISVRTLYRKLRQYRLT